MVKLKKIYNDNKLPEPKNEMGVVFIFSRHCEDLGFDGIKEISKSYPDCIAMKDGNFVDIEFEYKAQNYRQHGHHKSKKNCDLIVCWKKITERKFRKVNVLELRECDIEPEIEKMPNIDFRDVYEKLLHVESLIETHSELMLESSQTISEFASALSNSGIVNFDERYDFSNYQTNKVYCDICGKEFGSENGLKVHKGAMHKNPSGGNRY